jgi:hypothetical protein
MRIVSCALTLGTKLFATLPSTSSLSYRYISMILQCTGGGILIPIFINDIPFPLAQDIYPIAITISFLMHQYLPISREVMELSPILKVVAILMYETIRASVLVKLTAAAGQAISPSEFSIAVFGPIVCGTIAGCGGTFMPLSKGLDPIKDTGLNQPMISALIAATFYHFFTMTSLSAGVIDAPRKAHISIAVFFIGYHLYADKDKILSKPAATKPSTSIKTESKKTK